MALQKCDDVLAMVMFKLVSISPCRIRCHYYYHLCTFYIPELVNTKAHSFNIRYNSGPALWLYTALNLTYLYLLDSIGHIQHYIGCTNVLYSVINDVLSRVLTLINQWKNIILYIGFSSNMYNMYMKLQLVIILLCLLVVWPHYQVY